jgi:hypothetical protein
MRVEKFQRWTERYEQKAKLRGGVQYKTRIKKIGYESGKSKTSAQE